MFRQHKVTRRWNTCGLNTLVLWPAEVWVRSLEVACARSCCDSCDNTCLSEQVSTAKCCADCCTAKPSVCPTPRRSLWTSSQSYSKTLFLVAVCRAGNYFHSVSCQAASHTTGLSLDAEHLWAASQSSRDDSNRGHCELLSLILQDDTAFQLRRRVFLLFF